MDTPGINQERLESIRCSLLEKGFNFSCEDVNWVVDLIKDEIGYGYVNRLMTHVEKILDIDSSLTEKEILNLVAKIIVEYLGAEAASIRIYDPEKRGMVSFGSYPNYDEIRERVIPFEDTIAGEVVRTRRSYLVPNILKEEKYKNKEKVDEHGIHSMLAAPIHLRRFSKDGDIEGVFQIYYKEEDKVFTPLEVEIAEMISKPMGYVIALKRINYLHLADLLRFSLGSYGASTGRKALIDKWYQGETGGYVEELVRTIVRALVDFPEEIEIKEVEGSNTRILEIKVSKHDVGKLLGKKGRNITALRNIVSAASKGNKNCVIEVVEEKPFESQSASGGKWTTFSEMSFFSEIRKVSKLWA